MKINYILRTKKDYLFDVRLCDIAWMALFCNFYSVIWFKAMYEYFKLHIFSGNLSNIDISIDKVFFDFIICISIRSDSSFFRTNKWNFKAINEEIHEKVPKKWSNNKIRITWSVNKIMIAKMCLFPTRKLRKYDIEKRRGRPKCGGGKKNN